MDDFAHAPVVSAVGETVELKVDQQEWEKTLQDVTNLYKQYAGCAVGDGVGAIHGGE